MSEAHDGTVSCVCVPEAPAGFDAFLSLGENTKRSFSKDCLAESQDWGLLVTAGRGVSRLDAQG